MAEFEHSAGKWNVDPEVNKGRLLDHSQLGWASCTGPCVAHKTAAHARTLNSRAGAACAARCAYSLSS
jgi:hypothetical protein